MISEELEASWYGRNMIGKGKMESGPGLLHVPGVRTEKEHTYDWLAW